MGYCLLYPDGLFRVDPFPAEVCLIPELPGMACHSNFAQFEVSDAAGRSASEVADAVIKQGGISIERSSLSLAGEEAVVLDGVPAQDFLRDVLIVHNDRLYRLRFVLPDPENPSAVERFERLYDTVTNSFTLIPVVPPPATARLRHQSVGMIKPRAPSPAAIRAIPPASQSNPLIQVKGVRSSPSHESSQDRPRLVGHQLNQEGFWSSPGGVEPKLPPDWKAVINPWMMRTAAIMSFIFAYPFR
jgi:hypothetical protein